jgi:hypothetical protein
VSDDSPDALRAEISDLMDQVMELMGTGTMVIPDAIQRGMNEMGNPTLDEAGLRQLRDDLRSMRDGH